MTRKQPNEPMTVVAQLSEYQQDELAHRIGNHDWIELLERYEMPVYNPQSDWLELQYSAWACRTGIAPLPRALTPPMDDPEPHLIGYLAAPNPYIAEDAQYYVARATTRYWDNRGVNVEGPVAGQPYPTYTSAAGMIATPVQIARLATYRDFLLGSLVAADADRERVHRVENQRKPRTDRWLESGARARYEAAVNAVEERITDLARDLVLTQRLIAALTQLAVIHRARVAAWRRARFVLPAWVRKPQAAARVAGC